MLRINCLIAMIITLTQCSIDTKTGIWENKNSLKNENKLSTIDFNNELTFEEFKENVVLYGKKSKYPNIMEKNE